MVPFDSLAVISYQLSPLREGLSDFPLPSTLSAARVVLRDRPHQSTTALLSELHWLPVQSRITFKIACLTYKVLTTDQPYYLRSLLHYYTPHHTVRSVNQRLLEQPRVSTEFGKRSFSYLSPKTWNSIPPQIKTCPYLQHFQTPP